VTTLTTTDPKARLLELGLVDPTHQPTGRRRPAARLDSLAGKRAGLLDNHKGNADRLLARIGELLRERYEVGSVETVAKFIYSRRAEPEILDRLAAECDFVVTAIGD
jgi:hypothetical protein